MPWDEFPVCSVTQWRQDYLGVEVKGMSPKSGIANFLESGQDLVRLRNSDQGLPKAAAVKPAAASVKGAGLTHERRLFLAANIQTWKYRQYECLESRPKHERSGRMGLRVEDPELSIEVGWLRLVELGR
jgi:hypothetical protein